MQESVKVQAVTYTNGEGLVAVGQHHRSKLIRFKIKITKK